MRSGGAWAVGLMALASGGGLLGCAHGGLPRGGVAPVAAYYPLAVGNRWVYDRDLLGEKGTVVVEIVGRRGSFFEDNQGGELAVDGTGVRDHKRFLLQLPLERGATWQNVVSVSSVEHYRVVEAGEPCSAPAGRFEGCVKVESRNRVNAMTTLVAEFTFAPNVGIVRIRTAALTNGRRIPQADLDLRSYALKAPTP